MLVLAFAVALVYLTRAAPQLSVHGRGPASSPSGPEAPAAPASDPQRTSMAPSAPGATGQRPRVAAAPSQPPRLSPEWSGGRQELKRDENGRLVPIVPVQELRKQLPLMEAPMKACLERAGVRPTGKATLSFTVAAKDNKLFIESTGVQDEDTLAGYPDLLQCMRETAHVLVLDQPVPELGTPIYVRRHVRVEAGELVENTMFDFSYNH